MNFVQNILWNSVEGFVEAGTRSVGQYAGDALIKAGDAIENTGRGVGDKIERSASAYGQKVAGQGYQGGSSGKALPSSALKPMVKRSNSMPATTKAPAKKSAPRGRAAAPKQITNGAGGTAAKSVVGGAQKAIMSGVSGAKSTAGGAQKGVQRGVTGGQKAVSGTAQKSGATAAKPAPKPYPQNPPPSYAAATAKGTSNAAQKNNNAPKPYSNQNSTPSYPAGKKTAVKPGKPKPFVVENKALDGTLGKKTAVKPKPYGPTAEKGKMQHIPLSGAGNGGSQQKSTGGKTSGGGGGGAGGKMQHIAIGGLGSGSSTYGGSMKADKPAAQGGKFQHIAV